MKNDAAVKSAMDHPMDSIFQMPTSFEEQIRILLNDHHVNSESENASPVKEEKGPSEEEPSTSVKSGFGNQYPGNNNRWPSSTGLTGNAIPLPPNLAGVGITGPLLWQLGSSAENLIANLIGSLAGGIISGLGLQGYLSGGISASQPPYLQDNPLIGRGIFDPAQGGSPIQSNSTPIAQLRQIVHSFLNSEFAGKLISILSTYANNNGNQNNFQNGGQHFG